MTTTVISAIAGALAAAVPLVIGFIAGRVGRAKVSAAPEPPPRPVCACDHALGAHVDGRCQAAVRREHYMASGSRNGFEWVACACHRYVGPEHIADWWVPDVITEDR